MRKIFAFLAVTLLSVGMAWGQEYSNDVAVSNLEFAFDGQDLIMSADMDFSKVEPDVNEAITFEAVVYAGNNKVVLPLGKLLGKGWFYHYARERRTDKPFATDEHVWMWKQAPKPLHFVTVTPYQEWMQDAKLRIDAEVGACCGKPGRMVQGSPILSANIPEPIPEEPPVPVYKPEYIYVLPPAEATVKERAISGKAYVVFASGKTAVDPAYKDNEAELGKIRATIDSVRNDPDKTITRITLRGYSSPDGSYATNEKLALARTASIKQYVSGLYPIPEELYQSEAVAENWDGLRMAIEESNMAGRDKMLAVVTGDLSPDAKEAKLKNNWPKQWKTLVQTVFPLLRRTDYDVSYTVRSYTTTEDARRIMRTNPEKLSIKEFFLAAQGYQMGTREFDEVFAIAARMYPNNEVVNVNAANAALSMGNLQSAQMYLDRAGDGAVVRYTRGVLCALQQDWEGAVMYFTSAKASGVPEAAAALDVCQQLLNLQ
ncbi:MAG: hypothetical protein J5669_06840 [Bacteroidales bacterium]|nr:hypothetical protein [Bacteroidales bacterium]